MASGLNFGFMSSPAEGGFSAFAAVSHLNASSQKSLVAAAHQKGLQSARVVNHFGVASLELSAADYKIATAGKATSSSSKTPRHEDRHRPSSQSASSVVISSAKNKEVLELAQKVISRNGKVSTAEACQFLEATLSDLKLINTETNLRAQQALTTKMRLNLAVSIAAGNLGKTRVQYSQAEYLTIVGVGYKPWPRPVAGLQRMLHRLVS